MDGWIDGWMMDGWMDDGWMDGTLLIPNWEIVFFTAA